MSLLNWLLLELLLLLELMLVKLIIHVLRQRWLSIRLIDDAKIGIFDVVLLG